MKLDRKTLTEEQKALEKEFWVSFYITKDKKLWMKTNTKYEKYLIETEFKNSINQITSKYSKEEREGWDLQLKEAEKVIAGWTSPVITTLATASGITDLEYANLIKTKSEDYATAYATALATKREKLALLTI